MIHPKHEGVWSPWQFSALCSYGGNHSSGSCDGPSPCHSPTYLHVSGAAAVTSLYVLLQLPQSWGHTLTAYLTPGESWKGWMRARKVKKQGSPPCQHTECPIGSWCQQRQTLRLSVIFAVVWLCASRNNWSVEIFGLCWHFLICFVQDF